MIFNECCAGTFLSAVLLIWVFAFLIIGMFFGYYISFMFAARVLKMTETELRKAIESIDKWGNSDTKFYNYCINYVYQKNT